MTSCTLSTTHHETDIRIDLPNAQVYATTVLGRAIVTGPGIDQDVLAFNQTIANAPGSPEVNALFTQARAAARAQALAIAAGRPFVALTEMGPTLLSSSSTTSAAVQVAHFSQGTATTLTNIITIGPGIVLFGPDQSAQLFVAAGNINVNSNQATETFFEDDYQATTTNRATYELTVSLILQLIGTIHPALQSTSFDLGGRFLRRLGGEAGLGSCGANAAAAPAHCAWAEGAGLWSRDRAQGMVPGNEAVTGTIAGGLGFRIAPGLSLGFGIGQAWGNVDQGVGAEHGNLRFTQFGLDAAYASGGWRLAAAGFGARGHADTSHGTQSLGGVSTASYGLDMWGARGEIGYRIGAGGFSLTPKLGADWTRVHSDAFAEVGGPALTAPAHDANRTRGFVGLAAEDRLALDGQPLTLTAEARLTDVLSGRTRVLPVAFAGQALAVEGLTEGRLAGDLDLTAAFHFTPNATFALTGQGEFAQQGGRAWGGRAALSVGF